MSLFGRGRKAAAEAGLVEPEPAAQLVQEEQQQQEEQEGVQEEQQVLEEQDQQQVYPAKKQRVLEPVGPGTSLSPAQAKPPAHVRHAVVSLLEKEVVTPADLATLPGGTSMRAGDLRRVCDFLAAYRNLRSAKERHAAAVALLLLSKTRGRFQEVRGTCVVVPTTTSGN
jgi:hypothetical protein